MDSADGGRMSYLRKLAYGVGHVYNDLCGTMWFTYVLVYLQFVMKLPASTAGAVLMAGQFVEAIATPISGMESDRIKGCGNYGRRKSTHLFGTILTMIAFPFVFIELPGFDRASPEALLVYYLPVVLIFKVGWAAVQVSHLSMIPELSSDSSDRDDLAIFRYTFDMASDMSVYFVTWTAFSAPASDDAFRSNTIDPSDGWRFRSTVLILVGIGLLFNLVFHFFTVESPPLDEVQRRELRKASEVEPGPSTNTKDGGVGLFTEKQEGLTPPDANLTVSMKWSDWFREKHYFQVGILLVLSRLFLNLNQAFIPLFLQEGIRAPQVYLAIIPGVCQFSALAASLLVKVVLHVSTKKVAYIVGCGLAFSGCIWLGFDNPEAVRAGNIYPLSILIGAGTGMMLVLSTSFVSDLIGDNTESGAYVFGSIAFIHNLLNGLTVFLIQIGHGFCENCPAYYKNLIAHGLSLISVLSLAIVLFLEPTELGKRLSDANTTEGRAERIETRVKKYGATQKGFPLLQRADS